jgi:hypothetical protein
MQNIILDELREAGHGVSIFYHTGEGQISPASSPAGWRRAVILMLQIKYKFNQQQAELYFDSFDLDSPEEEVFHEDVLWFLEGWSMEQIEQIYKGEINIQNVYAQKTNLIG